MYRRIADEVEVFLVHPGGPIWAKKDKGAWTIPKGEYEPDENALAAARREFEEETGFRAIGEFIDLGSIKQKGGKVVNAWAPADAVRFSSSRILGQPDEKISKEHLGCKCQNASLPSQTAHMAGAGHNPSREPSAFSGCEVWHLPLKTMLVDGGDGMQPTRGCYAF